MNKTLYYWDAFLTTIVRTLVSLVQVSRSLPARFQQPSILEQSLLLKRLAMLLRSGMPISTSLHLLVGEGMVAAKLSRLRQVVVLVESGVPLSRAFEQADYRLSTFARNLIRIGETSGTLPENLDYIATELKVKYELRKQIIQALIYPAIIITATIAISVFLVVVIFPKIIPVFESVQATLPWSTRALLVISYVLSHYGFLILGGVVLCIPTLWCVRQFVVIEKALSVLILKVPIIGRLICSYQVAMSCRTLGILLSTDVRIVEALTIVTDSTEQLVYQDAWRAISTRVHTGQRLSNELRVYPQLFPAIVVQMIQAGETTGNLSFTLRYLADMYESDVRDITKNLTTLLEPILMLVMGLVVGFIAVSIITPIYSITQHLHG